MNARRAVWWVSAAAVVGVLAPTALHAPLAYAAPTETRYAVTLTRESQNQYRDDESGVRFLTRYCYEYSYSERAIYDDSREQLTFLSSRGTCEVAQVLAPPSPSAATTGSGVIETRMAGEFNGWEGETVFVLDNGQVWQQASYAYHYRYAYRPKVLIYPSGGVWRMQVEGVSSSIAVQRLA
ncbi:MAG: hypothetical protein AVDCRST_MAG77-4951 [uncultured Chloroflexi bacterium]|uniref:Uncharacterized protein n=1 Tax=uncultured Chloroflexota bacterium TaxID=166587 RepID=A0A6J4K1K1_9CHLR|nr:MAG: hypothetical protein AVDCRST_MAG77-4951 [uncultured Chloroflexota bacterium]